MLSKAVDIELLSIQTTNQCNLNCSHCMLYEYDEHGTDYNDYITEEIIDKFFEKDIRIIHTLNFTGGEPLLNIDMIIYTLEKIMKEKIKVVSIDIATNGTILSEKFINSLNKFSDYIANDILNNLSIKDKNTLKDRDKSNIKGLIQLRISRLYHDNDYKKAIDFYSKRANGASGLIDIRLADDENKAEIKKVSWGLEKRNTMAYSGRAKKLDVEYYCDSPHHKIVYEETLNKEIRCVRCPIELMANGDIGIACYCSIKDARKNAIGNVFDSRNLEEIITEWNYKTPLTCDEACNLAEAKMYYETKRLEDISRILGKNIDFDSLEDMVAREEVKYLYIENYRRLLHDKVPCLTSDEIEWISHFWLELEREKSNNHITDEEIRQRNEEIDNHIAKLIYEHSFDDIKEVHEEFPFLIRDECIELIKCEQICRPYREKFPPLHVIPYWKRGLFLIQLNEYREKNVKSIFD